MAARRLLIVMLVLLGISTLAAALMDTRPVGEEANGTRSETETTSEATTSTETEPEGAAADGGRLVRRKVAVKPKEKPQVVRIGAGDQLELTVTSSEDGQLEIPSLGLLEPVGPGAPARFDLLAAEPASYGIRLIELDRIVARIEVTKASRKRDGSSGA